MVDRTSEKSCGTLGGRVWWREGYHVTGPENYVAQGASRGRPGLLPAMAAVYVLTVHFMYTIDRAVLDASHPRPALTEH